MGRPVNKRNFGKGTGNQIKAKFKLNNTDYEGYIVSQRSTTKFRVSSMNDAVTGICRLVDKAPIDLDNGEMSVVVRLDDGTTTRATKIFNRTVTANGVKVPWNFDSASDDDAGQIADADATGLTPVITIDTDPANTSVATGDPATFTVVASSLPTTALTYQWEYSDDAGVTWIEIVGATDDELVVEDGDDYYVTGNEFRVTVSAAGAEDVVSAEATLTITV